MVEKEKRLCLRLRVGPEKEVRKEKVLSEEREVLLLKVTGRR